MGHDSTEGWTDDRRQSPHGAEQPERRPAPFQRHAIGNRGCRDREDASRAYSLNRSRDRNTANVGAAIARTLPATNVATHAI